MLKACLSAINKDKYPNSTLHYYIPKNADSIFFEVGEARYTTIESVTPR